MSSSSEKVTELLERYDPMLFGSLNVRMSDALMDRIEVALQEGLLTLPQLGQKSSLREHLQEVYARHVDLMEIYTGRNVFSLRNHLPPQYWARITEEYAQGNIPDSAEKENEVSGQNESSGDSTKQEYQNPTKEQIPTDEQMKDVQDELAQLRAQLKEARLQRNRLNRAQAQLNQVEADSREVVERLEATKAEKIPETLKGTVQHGQTLKQLEQEGNELKEKLERIKRERSKEEVSEYLESLQKDLKKKKRLSIEEDYKEHRENIDANFESLAMARKLLKN